MSEENVANETDQDEEVTQDVTPPQQKLKNLDDLEVGYLVGLEADGNFIFRMFGKKKDLLQLLGLHQHAKYCIQDLYNQTQTAGDALIKELGKHVVSLHNKFDQLVGAIAPKKPDNTL